MEHTSSKEKMEERQRGVPDLSRWYRVRILEIVRIPDAAIGDGPAYYRPTTGLVSKY